METLVDNNTAAIIINNPSNPSGFVYPKEHVREIAECMNYYLILFINFSVIIIIVAARHYLPIISDEIHVYAEMIFPGHMHISSVDILVPSIICGTYLNSTCRLETGLDY